MGHKTYSQYMRESNSHLTITLNLSKPIEIEDFARLFAGLGGLFDDYLKSENKELRGSAKLYVREVRKGSIVADLIPQIPDMIGYIDSALIVGGFAALFNKRIRDFMRGKHLEGGKKSELNHVTDAISSVANDPNGSVSIETIAFEENGENRRLIAKFTTNDARKAIKTIEEQKAQIDKTEHADYRRVTMLFERPAKTVAGVGKKTNEAALISEIDDRPLPIVYASELSEKEIKSHFQSENVFRLGFLVDVNVEKRKGKTYAYKIVELHQVFDLPDND